MIRTPPGVRDDRPGIGPVSLVVALLAAAAPGCSPVTVTPAIARPLPAAPAVLASSTSRSDLDLADGERLLAIPSDVWKVRQIGFEATWTDGDELALVAGLDVVASADGPPSPELVTWANRERVALELDCTRPPPIGLERGHCTIDRVTPQLLGGQAAKLQELGLRINKVTDADLGELASLGNVVTVDLWGKTRITDRGIEALSKVRTLRTLDLQLTGATDAGLRSLRALPHLVALNLAETTITDDGVRELAALEHLQWLDVSGTGISGAGVERLAGLRTLRIGAMLGVEDADLARIAKLAKLRWLSVNALNESRVTDAGLAQLAQLRDLVGLDITISRPHVSASGVARLAELTHLRELRIGGSAADDDCLHQLASLSRLRRLDLGGGVVGDAGLAHVARMDTLRWLRIGHGFGDGGLHHVAALPELRTLILNTPARATDLASLQPLRHLRELMIVGLPVTDARVLARLTQLRVLVLAQTQLGDAALRDVATLAHLRELNLQDTRVGDAGLAALSGLSALRRLYLDGTAVTDHGIEHLVGLERLQTLTLGRTQVGERARAALTRARPGLAVW